MRFHRDTSIVSDAVKGNFIMRLIPSLKANPVIQCQPATSLTAPELPDAINADATISEIVRKRALEMVHD